jgi:BirA family biotin operon repressor/biotin-[acetyl-CoA-carboxylase] ligase
MMLDTRAAATGVRLITHAVLDSTNAQALSLAQSGERGPVWIVAERQTAGRGRRGRAWVSQPGNLFASLLLTAVAPSERQPQLSLVTALALHDALAEVAPSHKPLITIKWPNDLLLRGKKIAGILIEAAGGENGAVAIGIGVNCASHPASTDYPATDLAAAGVAISPAMLFGPLSLKMIGRLAQWNGGEGFATVRADWLARAAGIGEEISVRLVDRELSGRFETLDQTGSLVLRLPSGRLETITAADVLLLAT